MIFKFQFTIKAYAKQRSFLNGCNHICRQYLQRLFFLFQIINKWFLLLLAFIELFVKQLFVRSLLNCVPSVLKTCSGAYVLCVLVCSCANVPCVLTCSRAYVLCVLTYSRTSMPCGLRAHLPTCLACLHAHVSMCLGAYVITR